MQDVVGSARVAVDSAAVIARETGAADGAAIGFRARRADDVSRRGDCRKFLSRPPHELHLLVAEKRVGSHRGRVIALFTGGRAKRDLGVDVHAAIEAHEDIFRRAVSTGDEGEIRAASHPRHGDRVFVIRGVRIRQAVGIETGIAIAAVLPLVSQGRGRPAILQNAHDGCRRNDGFLGRAPGKREVATGGNDHRV